MALQAVWANDLRKGGMKGVRAFVVEKITTQMQGSMEKITGLSIPMDKKVLC